MEKNAIYYWFLPVIAGLILVLIGVWAFLSPKEAYAGLSILFSLSFFATGLLESLFSIINRKNIHNWGWHLVFGLVTLILGVFLISHPDNSKSTLALFIGFTVLFRSFNAIGIALDLKKSNIAGWLTSLLFGILGVVFSFILIRNPVFAGMSMVVWIGVSLFCAGVFSVFFGFKMKGSLKD